MKTSEEAAFYVVQRAGTNIVKSAGKILNE